MSYRGFSTLHFRVPHVTKVRAARGFWDGPSEGEFFGGLKQRTKIKTPARDSYQGFVAEQRLHSLRKTHDSYQGTPSGVPQAQQRHPGFSRCTPPVRKNRFLHQTGIR